MQRNNGLTRRDKTQLNTLYDTSFNPIPQEWIEELKAAGVPMLSYDEMIELRKQRYIEGANSSNERADDN